MDISEVPDAIRFNKTPYWWVSQGNSKLADNMDEPDIEASINTFVQASKFWQTGSLKIEMSKNPKDRTGGYKMAFTKGANSSLTAPTMNTTTHNPYNLTDQQFATLRAQIEQELMFKEMHSKFGPLLAMVEDHEKRLKQIEKDEDGDGIPDFMETVKKGSEVIKNGMEVKKMFDKNSLFS